jgi:quercetin dioxygenase-like cupin family protein
MTKTVKEEARNWKCPLALISIAEGYVAGAPCAFCIEFIPSFEWPLDLRTPNLRLASKRRHATNASFGACNEEEDDMKSLVTISSASIALATALGLSAPRAFAGECPAGRSGVNMLAEHPTEPRGVTDTVIGSIDLGRELGVDGRDLRLRRLIVQPGGIVPFHSHEGRPAIIITLSGQILEYASNCRAPIMHRAGETVRETAAVSHYWVNRGKTVVELLSADVKGRD